jgi:hypothetical protein
MGVLYWQLDYVCVGGWRPGVKSGWSGSEEEICGPQPGEPSSENAAHLCFCKLTVTWCKIATRPGETRALQAGCTGCAYIGICSIMASDSSKCVAAVCMCILSCVLLSFVRCCYCAPPGASWSSIDYGGVWKPVHYGVARAFADVTLSVQHDLQEDTITVSAQWSCNTCTYRALHGSCWTRLSHVF